jgi:transmembrane sensor
MVWWPHGAKPPSTAQDQGLSVSEHSAATSRCSRQNAAAPPATATTPQRPRRLWPAATLAGAIVLGLWAPNLMRPPPTAWTAYSSVKGQTRRVKLADKSLLWMDGATSVHMLFDDRTRRAAFDSGEAEIAVALNNRPFEITVGDRLINTRGGDFDLSRYPAQGQIVSTLTMRQGEAAVSQMGVRQASVLRAGERLSWIDGRPADPMRKVNPEAAFAWQRRELLFNNEPLANVAATLNRYLDRPIVIPQPAVAQLRFTGALAIDREDRILKRLEAVAPVQADVRRDAIVLRSRPRPIARRPPPGPILSDQIPTA